MTQLNNRFSDAFSTSQTGVNRKNGPRDSDIVLGGVNFGRAWDEEDQAIYDLYLKSLEFDNNVDLMNYLNAYNSPSAQVQRMRKAGLNPDLQNIGNTPASGENVQAPSAPAGQSRSQRIAQYAGVAQQFLELIPQAIQLYQSIQGGFLDLDQKAIGVTSGIDNIAQSELSKQVHLTDLNNPTTEPRISLSHLPKRLQKRVEKQYLSYVDDFRNRDMARGFVYKSKLSGETPRQDYLKLLSNYGYDVNDDAFVKVLKSFNEVLYDSNKSKSQYDKDYYSTKSGALHAQTENKEVVKRGKEADNDIFVDLMSKANSLIDSNDKSDKVGGYIMYLLLGLMQNVSYTRTSGPKGPSSTVGF